MCLRLALMVIECQDDCFMVLFFYISRLKGAFVYRLFEEF